MRFKSTNRHIVTAYSRLGQVEQMLLDGLKDRGSLDDDSADLLLDRIETLRKLVNDHRIDRESMPKPAQLPPKNPLLETHFPLMKQKGVIDE